MRFARQRLSRRDLAVALSLLVVLAGCGSTSRHEADGNAAILRPAAPGSPVRCCRQRQVRRRFGQAMNASSVQLQNPAITDTVNNGIREFIFVLKRANYLLPPRAHRSFPLLAGRKRALAA
jgi:hypothetical protein